MKKYRKYVDVEYYRVIAMLVKNYQLYEISYSDDHSTTFIGDFYLKKQFVEGVNYSTHVLYRDYSKAYNSYHIGFDNPRMKNEVITYDNNPILFDVIDNLDANCYSEYIKRQKRKQLIDNVKFFLFIQKRQK